MAKRPVKPKGKTERKQVQQVPKRVEVLVEPKPKATTKNPWQPIETAPSNQLVYVQKDGAILAAILDGHWYVAADGRPTTTIIYDPSHWMPFPK